jgi:hypothetical protein
VNQHLTLALRLLPPEIVAYPHLSSEGRLAGNANVSPGINIAGILCHAYTPMGEQQASLQLSKVGG